MNQVAEPAHARLGMSNKRWPFCAGSPREEAKYEDISGDAAIDGTGSHLLLELCLNERRRAESFQGEIIGTNHKDKPNGWHVLVDRVERVQECLDYINTRYEQLVEEYPGHKVTVAAEAKSNPGGMFGRTDNWGTCDVTITVVNDHNRCMFMETIDYKDGRMWVGAKDNTQLIGYLIGQLRPFIASGPELVRPLEWHKIGNDCRVTIVQPKTDPTVRSDTLTSTEIGEWAEFLRDAAVATDNSDAPLVPDDKGGKGYCQWCKHGRAGNCNALINRDVEKLKVMTTEIVPAESGGFDLYSFSTDLTHNAQLMPVEKLMELADMEPGIMAIFAKAKEEIERREKAEAGSVPGWGMRPGSGSNIWNETQDKIEAQLKSKRIKQTIIHPKTLITAPAFMKNTEIPKAKRDAIAKEFITKKAGKLTLQRVPIVDKASAAEMFEVDFSKPAPDTVIEPPSFF